MDKEYYTIADYAEKEIIIEKSRFIGYIQPVETAEEAEHFISQIKDKHNDATHNVPVYLIGTNYEIQKYSDDGEPSGTAGIPVLEMLKKEGLTNLALVITRYFGGIKLGTGGLVRAYTNTAKSVLEEAGIVKKVVHELIEVKMNYTFLGKVQSQIVNEGYIIKDTVFLEDVSINVYTPLDKIDQFKNLLIQITNGKCTFKSLDQVYLAFQQKK